MKPKAVDKNAHYIYKKYLEFYLNYNSLFIFKKTMNQIMRHFNVVEISPQIY